MENVELGDSMIVAFIYVREEQFVEAVMASNMFYGEKLLLF